MVRIKFVDAGGTVRTVETEVGYSVMQAAVANDVPGIDAICGGACACATCHVYLTETCRDLIPPPNEAERSMLEFVDAADSDSRLSCQIIVDASLDRIEFRTPESQQ